MSGLKKSLVKALKEVFGAMAICTAIFIFVFLFLVQPVRVVGASMNPTLQNNEFVLAEKITFKFEPFKKDEIVIFEHPKQKGIHVIKRIEGLPNSVINGITIPEDAYYMLGDNKENSVDSRTWGAVDKKFIVGRAVMVILPLSSLRLL